MNPMQISQIVFVVVISLAMIVKCIEVYSLECEIEEKETMHKIVIFFKNAEIDALNSLLEKYEDMDWEKKDDHE